MRCDIPILCDLTRGDTETLEGTIPLDITNWKIRVQISDGNNIIKLATANVTGGNDNQIKVISTSPTESVFEIYIVDDATSNFCDEATIAIKVETTNIVGGNKEDKTIFVGTIKFKEEQFDWDDVT